MSAKQNQKGGYVIGFYLSLAYSIICWGMIILLPFVTDSSEERMDFFFAIMPIIQNFKEYLLITVFSTLACLYFYKKGLK